MKLNVTEKQLFHLWECCEWLRQHVEPKLVDWANRLKLWGYRKGKQGWVVGKIPLGVWFWIKGHIQLLQVMGLSEWKADNWSMETLWGTYKFEPMDNHSVQVSFEPTNQLDISVHKGEGWFRNELLNTVIPEMGKDLSDPESFYDYFRDEHDWCDVGKSRFGKR